MKKLAVVLGVLVLLAPFAVGQTALNSATNTASLSASVAESVTVSMTPTFVTFAPATSAAGTTSPIANLNVTTTGTLQPNRTGVSTFIYFTAATNVFTAPAPCAPSGGYVCALDPADFQGKGAADASFRAFGTDTLPTGWTGTGLKVATHNGTGSFNYVDPYQVQISTSKILSPGNYTGTLVVRAQAL